MDSTGQRASKQAGFLFVRQTEGTTSKAKASQRHRHLTFTMLSVSLLPPLATCGRALPSSHLLWRISGEGGRLAVALSSSASPGNSARPLSVGGQSSQAPPPEMQPGSKLVDDFCMVGGSLQWLFQGKSVIILLMIKHLLPLPRDRP